MDSILSQSMRPKLNMDTCYIPWHDGVYLRDNKNNCAQFKGKSLYSLLEHLAPLLDGNSTLEQLTEGLDADKKSMIVHLIEKLFMRHFVRDISQEQSHTPGPDVLDAYSVDIAFIEAFHASAVSHFESFCRKRLLVIGPQPGCAALTQASLRCGVRQIAVMIIPDDEAGSASFQGELDGLASGDAAQDVRLIEAPSWDNEITVLNVLQDYDAVIHISAQAPFARTRLLNRLCVAQQKVCLQAIILDKHAWIGPLISPESKGCWECAWLRLQANIPHRGEGSLQAVCQNQSGMSVWGPRALPAVAIIANRLLFEFFCYVTRTGSSTISDSLIDIDLETFQSQRHVFFPHPCCQACQHPTKPTASQFLEQIKRMQQQQPIVPDTFSENIKRCFDDRLGLFTTLDTGNFSQIPLTVYQASYYCPQRDRDQSELLSVLAASIDPIVARQHVLQKVCERYAIRLIDRRRLFSSEEAQQSSARIISPYQIVGIKSCPADVDSWTRAQDMYTQTPCLIATTCVFSSHQDQLRGVASGMAWEEALCQALYDWCNYLAVEQIQTAQRPYGQIDLVGFPMTAQGKHLYHLLTAAVGHITVYDVSGSLPVPTFATCLDRRVVSYSTDCDPARALSIGFERALQQYQSQHFRQPAYALDLPPDLPASLRSDQSTVPHFELPEAWPERLEWLLGAFDQYYGWHACVIPLDHDPSLMSILPYIVRVLLIRTEATHG